MKSVQQGRGFNQGILQILETQTAVSMMASIDNN
jgi:hypothetical protein